MDPLSVFGLFSTTADALKIVKTYWSLIRKSQDGDGFQRILSETEILHAMTLESASMLESLANAPPHSTEVALQQCEINAMRLKALVEKYMKAIGVNTSPLKRAMWTKNDIAKIEDTLGAFRVSASLLRQIAAE